ncbi:MAG: hypothetical protein AAF635_16425, partial [Cyanobacteria bacterium P01_C01_bin.69]
PKNSVFKSRIKASQQFQYRVVLSLVKDEIPSLIQFDSTEKKDFLGTVSITFSDGCHDRCFGKPYR